MRQVRYAAVAAVIAFLSPLPAGQAAQNNSETFKQLQLFGDVFERVRQDYVEPVTDEQLIESAISGMLSSLDPHSSYLNAKNFKDMQVQTRGEFGGLGLEVSQENGMLKVVSPIDNTPAAKAGIKPGDLIVQIDGESTANLSLTEAVDKMRGPANSSIKVTIRREQLDPFDVTMTREIIKVPSVSYHMESNNVGYVRISSFSEQTDSGLTSALADLKQKASGKLNGLVLDLRNNPGGLLDQAIAVSSDFLDRGEVVSTRGRRPEDVQRFNAKQHDLLEGKPMVLLINGGSASASEIVAGALQDHHRALLLGTKSFGKGSVQTIMPVAGGGAMRLTTARYYTPSGRSIQAKGIDPDIVVEPAKIERIEQGDIRHEADLKGALKNTDPDAAAKTAAVPPGTTPATPPAGPKTVDPTVIGTSQDYQLTRAVDLLRGMALLSSRAVD
ncbi:MAG TPA: S41 family peptidase [Stellaceae bacterium]|nr:S41 family peptidase [Stellaceae bacterium]